MTLRPMTRLGRVYDGEPAGLIGKFANAAHEGLRTGRPVVTSADYRHGIRSHGCEVIIRHP